MFLWAKQQEKNNVVFIHAPNNQPLDISVNKSANAFIAGNYQDWYAEKVQQLLNPIFARAVFDIRIIHDALTIQPWHFVTFKII